MKSPSLSAGLPVIAFCLLLVSCSDDRGTQPASAPAADLPSAPAEAPAVSVPSQDELRGTIGDKNQFGIATHACCELEAACCAIPGCCDLSAATGDACKSPKCPRIPQ